MAKSLQSKWKQSKIQEKHRESKEEIHIIVMKEGFFHDDVVEGFFPEISEQKIQIICIL